MSDVIRNGQQIVSPRPYATAETVTITQLCIFCTCLMISIYTTRSKSLRGGYVLYLAMNSSIQHVSSYFSSLMRPVEYGAASLEDLCLKNTISVTFSRFVV